MFLRIALILMLLVQQYAVSQEIVPQGPIPDKLLENANAVVRLDRTDIKISSRRSMEINKTRVVTVLNENGLRYLQASEHFDKSTSVASIDAVIYDGSGNQVKKIKRKDFKEVAVSEGSVITDNKMLYLDYTPVQYPFTMVFASVIKTSNTVFIPGWSAVEGPYAATEKSVFSITCNPELGFRYKEYNFAGYPIEKTEQGNTLTFTATNVMALKHEDYAPSMQKISPHVLFGLTKFHLEGVDGEADSWAAFGSWIYNSLLSGSDELPTETQAKIKSLVGNETDPMKKAKIVYEYVQGKTRYVSIQLGIGGWKPMPAKDVDRLGYGDCKALSNYTRALLKAVGVDSYYTVVYGDTDKRDITPDFVCMQGNHAILGIPNNGKMVWLECTSQVAPFGFQGDFTDDRMALVVKPDKGELVRTSVYDMKGNTQVCSGNYTISAKGGISGAIRVTSSGVQYDNKYPLSLKSKEELDRFYKETFSNINNLKLKKTSVKNDREAKELTEDIMLDAEGYCNQSGSRMMFAVNAFNQSRHIPQRYRERKMPFEVARGFYDTDEVSITLPAGFTIEAKPENVTIKEKFGEYSAQYTIVSPTEMLYNRSLIINDGYYQSGDYESYRQFREKIARNDNAKVVLVKNVR